jgi:S-adenosylhomocysteine hydrolase
MTSDAFTFKVADLSLADFGRAEITWLNTRCPA